MGGRPLLAHSIIAAKQSKHVTRVIVSTEDEAIAKTAKEFGAEVITRPAQLASDPDAINGCSIRPRTVCLNASLVEANLGFANLAVAQLQMANQAQANLFKANLDKANLIEANLARANLTRANLTQANLTDANLYRAVLRGALLERANLTGAILLNADLTDADLSGSNIAGATLTGATFCNTVMPDGKVNNSSCIAESKAKAVPNVRGRLGPPVKARH